MFVVFTALMAASICANNLDIMEIIIWSKYSSPLHALKCVNFNWLNVNT